MEDATVIYLAPAAPAPHATVGVLTGNVCVLTNVLIQLDVHSISECGAAIIILVLCCVAVLHNSYVHVSVMSL